MKLVVLFSMLVASSAWAGNVPFSVNASGTFVVEGVAHQFQGTLQLDKASRTEAKYKGKLLTDGSTADPFVQKVVLKLATDNSGKSTATFAMQNDLDAYAFQLDMTDLIPVSGRELKGSVKRVRTVCSASGCGQREEMDGAASLTLNY